jgi:hypothetical protein
VRRESSFEFEGLSSAPRSFTPGLSIRLGVPLVSNDRIFCGVADLTLESLTPA